MVATAVAPQPNSLVVRPQKGPQEAFLASSADIVFYGGAAGGGKTWGLLLEPLRHKDNAQFGAVIFRRTSPQVTNQGGMWDESAKLYPLVGARARSHMLEWIFPSGMRVKFAHMQYETDRFDWQGAQIPLIGFDELPHFTKEQFWYMLSRNRSTCGVKPYIRATCNPDPDSWVAELIAWWIDQETGLPIPERAGVVRWFVRVGDEIIWADSADELREKHPQIPPMSFTFIPANVYDNQALLERNPEYLAALLALPYVEREQLLGGNWKVRPAAGKVFNRSWFEIVEAVPTLGVECRFWDFAATEKKLAGDDPDYTAGVKVRVVNGTYYVTDCIAVQAGPAEVDRIFQNTTQQDAQQARFTGTRYLVRWEIEPGSAALRDNLRLVQMLAGHDAQGIPSQGDKLQRAKGLAAQALAGNVKLLRGAWNEAWLTHMHHQPDLKHDDIMDASSGAFNELTAGVQGSRTRRTA
jgi:predicted phage terminase large subunit-like protein